MSSSNRLDLQNVLLISLKGYVSESCSLCGCSELCEPQKSGALFTPEILDKV